MFRIEMAESVGKTGRKPSAKLAALLVSKSRIATVALRVLQVYLLMSHIEIAADDYSFFFFFLFYKIEKIVFLVHTIVETLEFVLGIGNIDVDEEEVIHLKCNDTPLVVVLVNADTIIDVERSVSGESSRSGISLFIGIVPERLISFKVQVKLSCLHLGFLNAEEIGVELTEDVAEAFSFTGPEAVYVP